MDGDGLVGRAEDDERWAFVGAVCGYVIACPDGSSRARQDPAKIDAAPSCPRTGAQLAPSHMLLTSTPTTGRQQLLLLMMGKRIIRAT